jgi:hypothetical protein
MLIASQRDADIVPSPPDLPVDPWLYHGAARLCRKGPFEVATDRSPGVPTAATGDAEPRRPPPAGTRGGHGNGVPYRSYL